MLKARTSTVNYSVCIYIYLFTENEHEHGFVTKRDPLSTCVLAFSNDASGYKLKVIHSGRL